MGVLTRRRGLDKERIPTVPVSAPALAAILAAYEKYELRPFNAIVHIVASQQRCANYESREGVWEFLLPNRRVVRIGTSTHLALYHGITAAHTSAAVQRLANEVFEGAAPT